MITSMSGLASLLYPHLPWHLNTSIWQYCKVWLSGGIWMFTWLFRSCTCCNLTQCCQCRVINQIEIKTICLTKTPNKLQTTNKGGGTNKDNGSLLKTELNLWIKTITGVTKQSIKTTSWDLCTQTQTPEATTQWTSLWDSQLYLGSTSGKLLSTLCKPFWFYLLWFLFWIWSPTGLLFSWWLLSRTKFFRPCMMWGDLTTRSFEL